MNISGLLQNYFGDAWNVFDFVIVLGSFVDIVYQEVIVSSQLVDHSYKNELTFSAWF